VGDQVSAPTCGSVVRLGEVAAELLKKSLEATEQHQ
jgi:hypothetical protein